MCMQSTGRELPCLSVTPTKLSLAKIEAFSEGCVLFAQKKTEQSKTRWLQGCHFPENMKFSDFSRLNSAVSLRPFRGV